MKQNINGTEYTLVSDYRDRAPLRRSFNSLAQRIFGLDFEPWYQRGFWGGGYIPYSLCADNEVVANVSLSIQRFHVFGVEKQFAQLGTVMTHPEFRGLGLSGYLLKHVLALWKDCDLIFLYANDGVQSFYPKFGFTAAAEYQCGKILPAASRALEIRKLDMRETGSIQAVSAIVKNSKPLYPLHLIDHSNLTMFYAAYALKDCVYRISDPDAMIMAEHMEDSLVIYDVFSPNDVDLDEIAAALARPETRRVLYGFTPEKRTGCEIHKLQEENSTLFVLGDARFLQKNHAMFPLLSHT